MNEFAAMLLIILIVALVLMVGGKLALDWLELQGKRVELQVQRIELQIQRTALAIEEERTEQKKEETRQKLIEPVAARARAVNLMPYMPVAVLLLFLVPAGAYAIGCAFPGIAKWAASGPPPETPQERWARAEQEERDWMASHRPA